MKTLLLLTLVLVAALVATDAYVYSQPKELQTVSTRYFDIQSGNEVTSEWCATQAAGKGCYVATETGW